jgi:hypothetical protein
LALKCSNTQFQTIQSIISQYPDAKLGFLKLLQLFAAKFTIPTPTPTPVVTPPADSGTLLFDVKDVSFLKPRKKFDIKIFANSIQLAQANKVEVTINNKECIRLLCINSSQKDKKTFTLLLFYTPTTTSSTPKKKKVTV